MDTMQAPTPNPGWQGPPQPYGRAGLPKVQLEIVRGRARHRIRPVRVPVFLIGSAGDCDLVLGDPEFPEVHTYLFLNAGSVSARHLGAGAPLLVDGRIVKSAALHDGDVLSSGPYEFRIRIDFPRPEGSGDRRIDSGEPLRESPRSTSRRAVGASSAGIAQTRGLLHEVRNALTPTMAGVRLFDPSHVAAPRQAVATVCDASFRLPQRASA